MGAMCIDSARRQRENDALTISDSTECALVRFLLSDPEQGREILERLIKDLGDKAVVEFRPRQEGNTLHLILAPPKVQAPQKPPTAPKPPAPAPPQAPPAQQQ